MPRPLTDLGLQMLATLPPVLRESHDYQAVVHCFASEIERAGGSVEQVRAQFNPATADILLPAWEAQLRLPVGGAGASISDRRARVLARIRRTIDLAEGREWEAQMNELIGPGWSYLEHIAGDGTTPPAGTLLVTLPYAVGSAEYVALQPQVRELVPAHLAITFASSVVFRLDVDAMDITEFGA